MVDGLPTIDGSEIRSTNIDGTCSSDSCLLGDDGTSAYLVIYTDRRFEEAEILARYRAAFGEAWTITSECPGGEACLEPGSAFSVTRGDLNASVVMSNYATSGSYEITIATT